MIQYDYDDYLGALKKKILVFVNLVIEPLTSYNIYIYIAVFHCLIIY